MRVELTKFRVKQGKENRVDEWMKFLNEHMEKVLLTLEDEKMYVETIFREKDGNFEYLYWCSVQGEGGQTVEESDHWVDRVHLQYWRECIDYNFEPVDMKLETVMIPEKIRNVMEKE